MEILIPFLVISGMVLIAYLLIDSADTSARHKKFLKDMENWEKKEKKSGAR